MHSALAEELKAALERQWARPVDIDGLERLSVGASREMWRFDALSEGGTFPLILRHPPADVTEAEYETALVATRSCERELQQALYEQGVKVPEVIVALGGEDTEVRTGGFIMERLPGEGMPQRILTDSTYSNSRRRLPQDLAEAIATAHGVPASALPPLATLSVDTQIQLFQQLAERSGMEHPGYEWALCWLRENKPPEVPVTLVHGDFRLGNFVADENGLSGIVDWELAHLGDPMEDLAWLCLRSWRFSRPDLPVAGLTSREALFKAYEKVSGATVDPGRVHFWEALGNIKWGAICLMQSNRYHTSEDKSGAIENAAIGRRFDEALYDFFHVIDKVH
ncbi:MAG TPA: phosphotransferase family protein [Halieaceae bacterium]|nr:MAG: phosphotransferase family protein [Gammaproteobacteria bacterium]HDY83510.1 phosphotransferase family protein [Halieaceae bacterium]